MQNVCLLEQEQITAGFLSPHPASPEGTLGPFIQVDLPGQRMNLIVQCLPWPVDFEPIKNGNQDAARAELVNRARTYWRFEHVTA